MITVKSMLQQKGDEIFTLSPDSTIREALKLMAEKQIGAVMILEGEDKKVAGIFSERDYARLNANQRVNYNTPLKDVMTTKVVFCEHQRNSPCRYGINDRPPHTPPACNPG